MEENSNVSIFAQTMRQKGQAAKPPPPSTSNVINATLQSPNMNFGQGSHIVESGEADSIHKENAEMLRNLGENAILEERKRLLNSIDPSIIQFIKQKRQSKLTQINETSMATKTVKADSLSPPAEATNDIDIEMKDSDNLPELDVLNDENSKNWLNFNVVEPEKLEWMRDLPAKMPKLKPGEQYEARFDWKGVLLPFLDAENSTGSTAVELYLHGDSAQRPGYTLQELFRLGRSTVAQQRLSALGSINGILSIYNQGYYDGIFELPISKIFFLLRYAFDDNTPTMLEISAKALATLFYNETDEVGECLMRL